MSPEPKKEAVTIRTRIMAFYHANPDEELTREMLMVKFELTLNSAKSILRALYAEGILEHAHVIRLKVRIAPCGN